LFLQDNNGYANARQCYVIITFPLFYNPNLKVLVSQNICLIPAMHCFPYVSQEIRRLSILFLTNCMGFLKYVQNIIPLIYL